MSYFAIGIEHPKTPVNTGTLWRTAYAFGAAFCFTIGRRFQRQASDTVKAWSKIPMFEFADIDDLHRHLPHNCILVAVENCQGATPIVEFQHPRRAVYLLGSEDNGIKASTIQRCHRKVILPGRTCLNVATAGALVMYDRSMRVAA